jgi:tetrahydromethanopterin S-methyltransferase subunit A
MAHSKTNNISVDSAAQHLRKAVAAKKCWKCGCLHGAIKAIEKALPEKDWSGDLSNVLAEARSRLQETEYDCLGCKICYPSDALNVIEEATGTPVGISAACPAENVKEREGWPPLPGSYTVLMYNAPVAICTLTDSTVAERIASQSKSAISIIGSLQTENLGIERLILNILANPNIRFLIVCGEDSRQKIGHLPGQSLIALSRNGVNERRRIEGAQGKRPVMRNVSDAAIEHFRQNVEVIDLIGEDSIDEILKRSTDCVGRNPGSAKAFESERSIPIFQGYIPERMISDPAGYFVVYVDRKNNRLALEHYSNAGVLDNIIEGKSAIELYIPAVENGLLSRLDHAAYLGRELARAEDALLTGKSYVQDAAPEKDCQSTKAGCKCG